MLGVVPVAVVRRQSPSVHGCPPRVAARPDQRQRRRVVLVVVPAVVAGQEEVLAVPLPVVARVVLVARVVRDSVVSDTALQICTRRVSVSAVLTP